jgi:HK97 family phage major capsid protein
MTEDGRLALLLDWVREFEALDDDEREKHMRALAGTAAMDAGTSTAAAFWRGVYDLALVIDEHGSPPPVEAVQAVRAALAQVLDGDLLHRPELGPRAVGRRDPQRGVDGAVPVGGTPLLACHYRAAGRGVAGPVGAVPRRSTSGASPGGRMAAACSRDEGRRLTRRGDSCSLGHRGVASSSHHGGGPVARSDCPGGEPGVRGRRVPRRVGHREAMGPRRCGAAVRAPAGRNRKQPPGRGSRCEPASALALRRFRLVSKDSSPMTYAHVSGGKTLPEWQHEARSALAQARALNDHYDGKAMPAEAAFRIERLLNHVSDAKRHMDTLRAEQALGAPDYKHDMLGGFGVGGGGSHDPSAAGFGNAGAPLSKATKSFLGWVRDGQMTPERKADLVENATGLNLIPTDYAGTILKELPREGVMRRLAYVRPTTKAQVDIGNVTINTAGWGRLETGTALTDGLAATPAAKDSILVHDLNALVKIGRDELEDSDEDLAEVIRQALVMKFAELEDDAFAAGSGTGQPFGIATRATGGVITQSVTAGANATVTGDNLKALPFAVPAQFRRTDRAAYVMHTSAAQATALLKDTAGNYLVQPSNQLGEPDRLFGYRAFTMDGLPAMTATGTATDPSVIFGDFQAGYMIADRRRVSVQRLEERYADEGKVGLLVSHRVGGDVIRPKAFAKYLL